MTALIHQHASQPSWSSQNIDDIIYRYSFESTLDIEKHHEAGTPLAGTYANDGLWDEDDNHTVKGGSSRLGQSGKSSLRSRSATVSTVREEAKVVSGWHWGRKAGATVQSPKPDEVKTVKEKKSKGALKVKGRKAELAAASAVDESVSRGLTPLLRCRLRPVDAPSRSSLTR